MSDVLPSNLVSLLRAARCPNANCDNNGCITVYVGEGCGVEQEQCQWCYERNAALNASPMTPLTYSQACDLLARYAIAVQDRQCCGDELQPALNAALKACTDAMGVSAVEKNNE
jgi:hypothetical protein